MVNDNGVYVKKNTLKYSFGVFLIGYIFIIYQLLLILINSDSKEATLISIVLLSILFAVSTLSAYIEMNNIMLALFYICLFNFQFSYFFFGLLLGYEFWIIPDYYGETVYSNFSSINEVLLIIGLSIIVIHFVLLLFHQKYQRKQLKFCTYYIIDSSLINIRKVSKVIILITGPFAFYFLFKQIQYVMINGYQAYFLATYSDMGINIITSQLETMFRVAIAIYFATYPSRRELRIPLCMYVIYTLMYLGTGDRTNVAVLFLMLIWYFSEYSKRYSIIRLKKKFNLKIVVTGLTLVAIFSIWNQVRYSFGTGRTVNFLDTKNSSIIEFLISQGRSYNTILKAISIDKESIISFSDRFIMLFQPLLHQLEGMSFGIINMGALHKMGGYIFTKIPSSADLLSIYTNSHIYLSGGGLGSSYLAEGVLLGGNIGIIITSSIVALIIAFASYKSKGKFWAHSFVIFSFIFIMRFPRDLTFGMLAFLIPFIIRAALIYFVSYVLSSLSNNRLHTKE